MRPPPRRPTTSPKRFCEVTSSRSGLRITNISWDQIDKDLFALLPLGELLSFVNKPKEEVAISSEWSDHDADTLVHDAAATEEKLKDFWDWRHGVLK